MEARKRGLRKRIEPEKNSYILKATEEPAF
jgi:hypothetical protein